MRVAKRLLAARAAAVVLALAVAAPALAGPVVSGPTINGLATFTDVATGLNWVRLDSYFGLSYNAMAADVASKGFAVADVTAVHTLLDSLPLDSSGVLWAGYAAVMGSAPNRGLIWGAYQPETPGVVSWAFAFNGDPVWSFTPTTSFGLDDVPNDGTNVADMNIWAYQVGAVAVPEPSTFALAGVAGLAGLAALARRRKAAAA